VDLDGIRSWDVLCPDSRGATAQYNATLRAFSMIETVDVYVKCVVTFVSQVQGTLHSACANVVLMLF
jgi:hypothetical protein